MGPGLALGGLPAIYYHVGGKLSVKRMDRMSKIYKLPLVIEPQPEGGYLVTCPLLPELITEGDSVPVYFLLLEGAPPKADGSAPSSNKYFSMCSNRNSFDLGSAIFRP